MDAKKAVKALEAGIRRYETTVGDLIEAISRIAAEEGKSEAEGYELASEAIVSIRATDLRRARVGS